MSKREVQLYEVTDAAGITIAFAATIPAARRLATKKGDTYRPTNVPLRPDALAGFLTHYMFSGRQ